MHFLNIATCGHLEFICGKFFSLDVQCHMLASEMVKQYHISIYINDLTHFSDFKELVWYLEAGGRLEKPLLCPDEIYTLMTDCWTVGPKMRPNFKELKSILVVFDSNCVSEAMSHVALSREFEDSDNFFAEDLDTTVRAGTYY